jgi:prepilin-type N-terminal cleavage/methylation domain-containing protein
MFLRAFNLRSRLNRGFTSNSKAYLAGMPSFTSHFKHFKQFKQFNQFKQQCRSKKQAGFSLIELLVSVALVMLVVGLGVPAYLRFKDRQQVQQAKQQLETMIQMAKSKAQSGQMGACTQLSGYQIAALSSDEVRIREVCADPTEIPDWTAVSKPVYQLPTAVQLSDGTDGSHDSVTEFDLEVSSLGGRFVHSGGSLAPPWDIVLQHNNPQVEDLSFTINAMGVVSEGS